MKITELETVDEIKDDDYFVVQQGTVPSTATSSHTTQRIRADLFKYEAEGAYSRTPFYSATSTTITARSAAVTSYTPTQLISGTPTSTYTKMSNGAYDFRMRTSHNQHFRGRYLGDSYTTAQQNAVKYGTFNDMYIGDYWIINGITWRIAHFMYEPYSSVTTGKTSGTTTIYPNVAIMPDQPKFVNALGWSSLASSLTLDTYFCAAKDLKSGVSWTDEFNNAFPNHAYTKTWYTQNVGSSTNTVGPMQSACYTLPSLRMLGISDQYDFHFNAKQTTYTPASYHADHLTPLALTRLAPTFTLPGLIISGDSDYHSYFGVVAGEVTAPIDSKIYYPVINAQLQFVDWRVSTSTDATAVRPVLFLK